MKKIWLCLFILIFQTNSFAQKIGRPKLVVGIVIDQMRWDYLYRYYERYSNDGFKRLMHEGYNCQNTFLNYIPSYTAPGHASIYTGSVPALHGIVGNDWMEQNKTQYCTSDTTIQSIGGSQKTGKMSPIALKSSTIGDELRLANNFRSRVFGIALKDRGAIFPAGHSANAAFWFDDSSGHFISSSYYLQQLPNWLLRFNNKRWADSALVKDWQTLYPIASYRQSISDNNNFEHLQKGETYPTFPHKVSVGNYKQIRSLPAGNSLSFKLAKALIRGEQLGKATDCDLLCLSLSATDYIGHSYAPNSVEIEDTYLRLDQDIASFLNFLDQEIGVGNYTIFLTADHGAAHNANYLQTKKIPAGTLSETKIQKELQAHLKKKFNCDSLVATVMNYQIFLNEKIIKQKNLSLKKIKQSAILFCKNYDGIAQAIDWKNAVQEPIPASLKTAIINGYYPQRCGHIVLLFQAAHYSDGAKGTTHGTWNPYDTHIPLLWYGWGIPQGEDFKHYEVTDIATTLAALLHIQMPNSAIGKVIKMR